MNDLDRINGKIAVLCEFLGLEWYRCPECDGARATWGDTCDTCRGGGRMIRKELCGNHWENGDLRECLSPKIECLKHHQEP